MKNKQSYNFTEVFTKRKYITDFLSDNIRNSENSKTHRWTLILTTWVCGAKAGSAVPRANGSVDTHKLNLFKLNGMARLYAAIMASLLYGKNNIAAVFFEGVDV
ncbi:MAG TPA: hypothetical protein C5S51_09430 [Methanosarcinaceae archaeon]|nr:hypothetical protein [Methanosarcinaceae archaeon]